MIIIECRSFCTSTHLVDAKSAGLRNAKTAPTAPPAIATRRRPIAIHLKRLGCGRGWVEGRGGGKEVGRGQSMEGTSIIHGHARRVPERRGAPRPHCPL